MQISGAWMLSEDGGVRPVIPGEIQTADGSWLSVRFLVDTAADRTAFSAEILRALGLQHLVPPHLLGGVGGVAASVLVETQVRLPYEANSNVVFRGQFAAFTDEEALDMSVLGRDITNLFAAIVDRPGDIVCLLGQRHYYTIHQR